MGVGDSVRDGVAARVVSGVGVPVMAVTTTASRPPAVRFGEGRRPESATQVQLPEFEGPLALLLSLIEARQLDILTVPLGALADAYLDALARLEEGRLGHVSSFVTIASQLILIKSRAMLPRRTDPTDPTALADEGPDPEAELRARLILYRAYRDAGSALADRSVAACRHVPAGAFRRSSGRARRRGAHSAAEGRSRRVSFGRSIALPRSPCRPSCRPKPSPGRSRSPSAQSSFAAPFAAHPSSSFRTSSPVFAIASSSL